MRWALPKLSKEKVRDESTNNWVFRILPIGVDEQIRRNVISVSKIGVPCSLVLDIRESADGFNVDPDHAEIAFLDE
jgi:hypothetical protein